MGSFAIVETGRNGSLQAPGRYLSPFRHDPFTVSVKNPSFASGNARGDEFSGMGDPDPPEGFPFEPVHRIDPENPVNPEVMKMVGDKYHPVADENRLMKIM
jgi:hypothetical protein